MTDDRPNRSSVVESLAGATLGGVLLGSITLLVYGPRRVALLLPACAAGVAFAWVMVISGLLIGRRTRGFFSMLFVSAGAVAGLAWSAVSPERVSPGLACGVGAGLAAVYLLVDRAIRHERS